MYKLHLLQRDLNAISKTETKTRSFAVAGVGGATMREAGSNRQLQDKPPESKNHMKPASHSILPCVEDCIHVKRQTMQHISRKASQQMKAYSERDKGNVSDGRGGHTGNSQNTTKVWENVTKQSHEKTWESWGEKKNISFIYK